MNRKLFVLSPRTGSHPGPMPVFMITLLLVTTLLVPAGAKAYTMMEAGDQYRPDQLPVGHPVRKALSLSQKQKKQSLLVFVAPWCGACKAEISWLGNFLAAEPDLAKKIRVMIVVNPAEENWQSLPEKHKDPRGNLLFLTDPKGKLATLFGANEVPANFGLGQEGLVHLSWIGFDPRVKKSLEFQLKHWVREANPSP